MIKDEIICSHEEVDFIYKYLTEKDSPVKNYVSQLFSNNKISVSKGTITSLSELGDLNTIFKTLGYSNKNELFKISEVMRALENNEHPDAINMKNKIEYFIDEIANNTIKLIVTLDLTKSIPVCIDGNHRAIAFYEYNKKGFNERFIFPVYILRA